MKQRPIFFSGDNVRAILDGRKRMTRRVMEPQPMPYHDGALLWQGKIPKTAKYYSVPPYGCFAQNNKVFDDVYCPYGKVGDRLWVREAVRITRHPFIRPSISRWASRITLEITEVRVERLQSISEEDAKAEGVFLRDPDDPTEGDWDYCSMCGGSGLRPYLSGNLGMAETECGYCDSYRKRFHILWDKINGKKHPWAENPYVWVIGFRRIV